PVTTTPVPDVAGPTPLEASPLDDELEDEVADDDESALDVAAAPAELEGVDEPGMVAALTALKSPTPATAARAAPVVMRLSSRIAASLASILASSVCLFMVWKLAGRP
ncbi:MAG TPA: hypothetical protein VHQ03_00325, partial [Candidatus Dormibacteraeota bacterium]|nr:hypothetical protein [Candidatus Dormibacteraeota bacterium]